MKQISTFFLLLVIITSCQRNELQTISKEVLSKELTEVQSRFRLGDPDKG